MISIDQVLLLQQKIESAVQKIVELKSENDALRSQCSELTNALSEKTELLNSFTADEKKIEDTILSALDRLNKIENSVLSQADQNTATQNVAAPLSVTSPVTENNSPLNKPNVNNTDSALQESALQNSAPLENIQEHNAEIVQLESNTNSNDVIAPEFDLESTSEESEDNAEDKEEKFDIF